MADPPQRRPFSQTRLPITVIEENIAPPREEKLLVAAPVARKPTPVGMPAPPHDEEERQSYDDIEHVTLVDRLERERAQLLAELQDTKQENRLLRETAPTVVFPPPSIPPPPERQKAPVTESAPMDVKALEKALLHSRLGRGAVGLGILASFAWNAFNSVHAAAPERVDAVQARVSQSEQERDRKLVEDALERQRTLAALRALRCWGQQVRGALRRQGIDLQTLPAGGVTALRLDQGDPTKPPAFVVEEKCPDFPQLPPEASGASP
jgi:hypothetical protein